MLVRKWTAIRDAMNIADGRQLKTGSALFNACQMFSSKSAQEVVTQKKKNHVVFTDYQLPHVLAMLTSNIYADYDFSLFRKSTWGGVIRNTCLLLHELETQLLHWMLRCCGRLESFHPSH